MLFHVQMAVNIPLDFDKDTADQLKANEKALSQELQRSGKWLHLWRVVGKYSNVSVFDVANNDELHEILSTLPLFPFMQIEVTPLAQHYSSIK
jgi:muconolactone D-isomerase